MSTDSLISMDLLLSTLADELFAPVAAFGDAAELSLLDIPEGQLPARQAIRSAVRNARMGLNNPGAKICLLKGDAGSGKSHVLTTVFKRLSSQNEIYPVVLQLSAPVKKEDYIIWLVDAVIRQLSARHFANATGQSPLRRLGERLLDFVDIQHKERFESFVENLDNDDEIVYSMKLGQKIAKAAEFLLPEPPSARFLAVLILASYGDFSALEYLRHGKVDRRLEPLELSKPKTTEDFFQILRNLGFATRIVSGCLAVAFDQVENIRRLGSDNLFIHTITQAVRLVEDVSTCAVVIATLGVAYDEISDGLLPADRDRIERAPPFPVSLDEGSQDFKIAVIAHRLAVLRQRAKLEPCSYPLNMIPDWLVLQIKAAFNVRFALREFALFRSKAAELGHLPTEHDFGAKTGGEAAKSTSIDFDKEWADHQDTYTVTQKLIDPVKADLIGWWAKTANKERLNVDPIEPDTHFLDDLFKTPVIDVNIGVAGVTVERRELALCEAPNRNQKLADQVEHFLAGTSAVPLVLRTNGFPKSRTAQVAPALRMLDHLFGLKLDLNETEWHNLNLAKEFFDKWRSDAGFETWQREKQWLLQLVSALQPLIAVPDVAHAENVDPIPGKMEVDPPAEKLVSSRIENGTKLSISPDSGLRIRHGGPGAFPVLVGDSFAGDKVFWDPYRASPSHLNNFSFLVTGDAGSGKTQTIRSLIDAACRADIGLTVFDFKGDYCAPEFAHPLGIHVIDVRASGLPFNPLQPPPRGASGTQPIEHAYEIASILKRVFKLGEVQEGHLRDAISQTYAAKGIEPREWIDPDAVEWPSFDDVLERLRDGGRATANLVTKLSLLSELGLFRLAPGSSLVSFLRQRSCLKLNELPSAEAMSAIAEILIVQLHGYALRGDQPRRLTRMMVFDEAHRVKDSKRLETLAREGRAFGVGIVIGTQFPGDIPETMAGNLATQLCLMNNQAQHRRLVVSQMLGTTSGSEAHSLLDQLSHLRPLEGIFQNAHYSGTLVRVLPHYARKA